MTSQSNSQRHYSWKQAAYMHSSGITVRQWALSHNVCYFNIREHILAGMNPDEACLYAQSRTGKHDTKHVYFINGIPLIEYCRKNNLNYETISGRCRKGIPIEKAISMPRTGGYRAHGKRGDNS